MKNLSPKSASHCRPRRRFRTITHRNACPGTLFARRRSGTGKDTHGAIIGSSNQPEFPPDTNSPPILCPPILPAPTSFRKTKPAVTVNLSLKKVRSFPKSYWRTKSIGLPPKTQAALLESKNMMFPLGGKLTIWKTFFVLATQNPIEQEGTTCPKLKRDRFFSKSSSITRVVTRKGNIGAQPPPSNRSSNRSWTEKPFSNVKAVKRVPVPNMSMISF